MATPSITEPGRAGKAVPGVLESNQLAAAGEQVCFTGPANTATQVTMATVANVSGAASTYGFGIAKAGAGLDATHWIVPPGTAIAAGASVVLPIGGGLWLGDGDEVIVNPGAAAAIDVGLSGITYS